MYDLSRFSLSDGIRCGAALRTLASDPPHAQPDRLVRTLFDSFRDPAGERQCALVRLYRTRRFGVLPEDLRAFARQVNGAEVTEGTPCLTLLASTGEEEAWNDVTASEGHRTIPLPSEEVVLRSPMVSQLIHQFGMELSDVIAPDPEIIVDLEQQQFNVFFVPDARGSAHVPAQDFVETYGIRSVLGFGGLMPDATLFAIIMFTKVHMDRASAEIFRTLALNVKLVLLDHDSASTSEGVTA